MSFLCSPKSFYRFYTCYVILTPLASIQYSYLSIDKYHERGAQDLNLHVRGQDYNFLESSLGLKAGFPIQTRCGVFIPEVHGFWLHDFYRKDMDLKTSFSGVAADAGTFKTRGPSLPSERWDVGAGVTFISCCYLEVGAFYNYEFSKRWDAHKALIRVSKQF